MRWLGMGPLVKEFEERIAAFLELGDRKVVTTNTGTAALHVGLVAAGVGPGDEVITPSFNYVADHQAVRMTGAEVAMCDITEGALGIDVAVNSDAEMAQVRRVRQRGVDADTLARYNRGRGWEYDVVEKGFRYHLTDIAASVGISQIIKVEEFMASRQAVCRRYHEAFGR